MRILIYAPDGNVEAQTLLGQLNSQGHKAALRNSSAWRGRAEMCDKAMVFKYRAEEIRDAFWAAFSANFPIDLVGEQSATPESQPQEAAQAAEAPATEAVPQEVSDAVNEVEQQEETEGEEATSETPQVTKSRRRKANG